MAESIIKQVRGANITTSLGTGDDFNDIRGTGRAGFYTAAANVTNNPAGAWGVLLVISAENGACGQLFFNKTSMYFRAYSGTTMSWGPWRAVTFT